MKASREPTTFQPVTIVLESQDEVDALSWAMWAARNYVDFEYVSEFIKVVITSLEHELDNP